MNRKFLKVYNSDKWSRQQETFAMDLADMDLPIYQPFSKALAEKFNQLNNFTYKIRTQQYYEAIINWYKTQLNIQNLKKEHFIQSPSICQLYSCIVLTFLQSEQQVLIMTPVYSFYAQAALAFKRKVLTTNLIVKQNRYEIDFDDFQNKCSRPSCKLLALCHPHNPTGRIWTKNELQRIVSICQKNNVTIFSDEILCDIVLNPEKTPFTSLLYWKYPNIIVGNSISKSFNCSSIQGGYGVVKNSEIKQKLEKITLKGMKLLLTQFALMIVPIVYSDNGKNWINHIRSLILQNYNYLVYFAQVNLPLLEIMELEASYLVDVDLKNYFLNQKNMKQTLQNNRIFVNMLGAFFFPQIELRRVRICIAVQHQYFQRFLWKLKQVLRAQKL